MKTSKLIKTFKNENKSFDPIVTIGFIVLHGNNLVDLIQMYREQDRRSTL